MVDRYQDIINRGWVEMSKELDVAMPENANLNNGRYPRLRLISSFVLVFIMSIFILSHNIIVTEKLSIAQNITNSTHVKSVVKTENQKHIPKIIPRNKIYTDISLNHKNITISYSDKILSASIVDLVPYIKENKDKDEHLIAANDFYNAKYLNDKEIDYTNKNEDNENQNSENTSVDIKTKKHNKLSLSISSINNDFSRFGGFDGGISYSYMMNRRIGIITGIEHSLLINNFMSSPETNNSQVLAMAIPANSTQQTAIKENNSTDLSYFLGVPVGILYSIDNLSFMTGVKVSYLIHTSNLLNNKLDTQNSLENFNEAEICTTRLYEKFDYSFIFGIEYRVLKDFSLFSKFNISYNNFTNNYKAYNSLYQASLGLEKNKVTNTNLYFGLGIKYDFSKM